MDLLGFLLIVVLCAIIALVLRTYQIERKPEQKQFLAGTTPEPLTEGFWRGTALDFQSPPLGWQGKDVHADGTGINVFLRGGTRSTRYAFRMIAAKGLRDGRQVLRFEYDLPQNPWYVRFGADDVVETAPGAYLGKAYLRLLPGFPCAMGYFRMQK
jgi:hypothetical protein